VDYLGALDSLEAHGVPLGAQDAAEVILAGLIPYLPNDMMMGRPESMAMDGYDIMLRTGRNAEQSTYGDIHIWIGDPIIKVRILPSLRYAIDNDISQYDWTGFISEFPFRATIESIRGVEDLY